jgi:FkbH-like protein
MSTVTEVRTALDQLAFSDYVKHGAALEAEVADGTPLRIAILRSYTCEPLEPVLKVRLLLDGYRPTCWFGGYNQYVQEILDPQSGLHAFRPNMIVLAVRLEEMIPAFIEAFASQPVQAWRTDLQAKARELAGLAAKAATTLAVPVIVQNGTLVRPHFGIYDAQRADGQSVLVDEFNHALAVHAAETPGVYVWNFDAFMRSHGAEMVLDAKSWYVSRNPYKPSAYPALTADLFRYVRAALGRVVTKCVVLDLDNTLWGGVAGEDGLEGIKLGDSYPGNCYRDFQRALLRLLDRGIVLAINSKNNEADALAIIDQHPDMVLRRQHFAATRINWNDKAANLRSLAEELNIGIDSMVFVDDNPAECDLVRRELPHCHVVQLPAKPYLLPATVDALPGIETLRLTSEDRQKNDMYRVRAAQRAEQASASNLEDFLAGLDLHVTIEPAGAFSIPRVAQLTQKTNQWNMTTRRYSDAQIAALAADPKRAVLAVSARDRFGDHGIIGVLILGFDGTECAIDTFLLSCRVIGRGIEDAMLAHAGILARRHGREVVAGEFLPTAKNKPAEGFYERSGLQRDNDGRFRASATRLEQQIPSHIRLLTSPPSPARAASADVG